MIKSIANFLIIFFIFQQLKSQIDQNGFNPFCDETLQIYCGPARLDVCVYDQSPDQNLATTQNVMKK